LSATGSDAAAIVSDPVENGGHEVVSCLSAFGAAESMPAMWALLDLGKRPKVHALRSYDPLLSRV